MELQKERTKSLLWLLLIILVGVLSGATAYLLATTEISAQRDDLQAQISENKNQNTESEAKTTESDEADSTADWREYKNEKYGFQLTLTDDWVGYRVEEGISDSNNIEIKYLTFYLPTNESTPEPSGYASPMYISIQTLDDWSKIEEMNSDGVPMATKIFQNETHVFAYQVWQDPPSDLVKKQIDPEQVINTFKFTN